MFFFKKISFSKHTPLFSQPQWTFPQKKSVKKACAKSLSQRPDSFLGLFFIVFPIFNT